MDHMVNFGWGMGIGWVFMLLFWSLIILGIVGLVKVLLQPNSGSGKSKTALDILQERYARGEIDREEYERIKHDIQS